MNQPPNFDKPQLGPQAGQGQPPAGPTGRPGPLAPPGDYGRPPARHDGMAPGPPGRIRGTGLSILLFIITLGIYGYFWWGFVHAEMRRHSGQGIGGPVAVIITIFLAPVTAFLTCYEVQNLYLRRGLEPSVRTTTGLWYFPGNFILVGPIVWFVKTNGALNDYWRSLGAN